MPVLRRLPHAFARQRKGVQTDGWRPLTKQKGLSRKLTHVASGLSRMAQVNGILHMVRFRDTLLLLSIAIAVCACEDLFVPGPGMSASQLGPDSARCRLSARGMDKGYEFGASGSPRDVAVSMAAMSVVAGLDTVLERSENYNDCMQALGYQVAKTQPAAMSEGAPYSSIPVAGVADPVALEPAFIPTRPTERPLGMTGIPVDPVLAEKERLPVVAGLVVMNIKPGTAAADAHVLPGDILFIFDKQLITSEAALRAALGVIPPNHFATGILYRNGDARPIAFQF